MNEIISKIDTLKEDHPELILTNEIIRQYILDGIEELVKEVKEKL